MKPNPFLLAPLCLGLAAAILLLARAMPAPGVSVTRSATPRVLIAAPAHRPSYAYSGEQLKRDAGTRLNKLLAPVRRGLATVATRATTARPAVQRDAARLSRWATGRADDARKGIVAAAGATAARAKTARTALAGLDARLRDGQRRGGALLQSSLRQAGARVQAGIRGGVQADARTLARVMRTAPWSR